VLIERAEDAAGPYFEIKSTRCATEFRTKHPQQQRAFAFARAPDAWQTAVTLAVCKTE